MTKLELHNPFNAPIYHIETVSSTMDVSKQLASAGEAHGTVIIADFQEAGRGRVRNRSWEMARGENLPFTILLRYPKIEDVPPALTLRAGLAVAFAIEDYFPSLQGFVFVKWPNDIFIGDKKTAGILCEAVGCTIHLGIGINVLQKILPFHLQEKATSIALAAGNYQIDRFSLLEKILDWLFKELEISAFLDWKYRLEERLYKKGEVVTFIEGAADSCNEIKGYLSGIGKGGELLIVMEGESMPKEFICGEFKI